MSLTGLWSLATSEEGPGLPPGVASIPTLSPGWANWEDPLSCWETPGLTGEVAWSSWILPTGESPSLWGTGPETSCLPITWGKRLSWHCRQRERSCCLWEESWTLRGLSALPLSPWGWWRVPIGLESKLLILVVPLRWRPSRRRTRPSRSSSLALGEKDLRPLVAESPKTTIKRSSWHRGSQGMRRNSSRKSHLDLRRIWRDRILNIPPFTRRVRDERWPRRRRQRAAGGSGDERNSSMILRRFPTHVAVGFVMNRTDWICMSREVMSWDGIKDDFLQWLVVPAPHTLAGACPSPGYQWSWIRLESTNCLGIGASRQRNDVEWWTLEPSVV